MLGLPHRSLVAATSWFIAGSLATSAIPVFAATGSGISVRDGTAAMLSAERAGEKRQAILESVEDDRAEGRYQEVAESLERDGGALGDPETLLEAGAAWMQAAEQSSDVEQAERAEQVTLTAIDILYFYRDVGEGKVRSRWTVIEPQRATALLSRAESQLEDAQALIENIRNPPPKSAAKREAGPGNAKKKRDRKRKPRERGEARPGTGMIAAGSVMTAIAAGGAALSIAGLLISRQKQNEVETQDPDEDLERIGELDEEGKRANLYAYVGLGIAGAALAVGIPLLVLGVKKRKAGSSSASLRVTPRVSASHQGVWISGRF